MWALHKILIDNTWLPARMNPESSKKISGTTFVVLWNCILPLMDFTLEPSRNTNICI